MDDKLDGWIVEGNVFLDLDFVVAEVGVAVDLRVLSRTLRERDAKVNAAIGGVLLYHRAKNKKSLFKFFGSIRAFKNLNNSRF